LVIKLGVNTFIWSAAFDQACVDRLPAIKDRGFDGVEVPLFRTTEFPARLIRQLCDRWHLERTVCSVLVPGFSLIDEDPSVRRKTVQHMKEAIAATAAAGARLIAGPLYCPVGWLPGRRRTADEWKWAIEAYQELCPTLEANDVTLGIEPLNRFETFFLNTASDARALAEAVDHPRVGILYDTFHANIEEKNVAEGIKVVGNQIVHFHTCENDRGTPGSGHVPWAEVFDALQQINYSGWWTIESFGFSLGDLSAAAAIWRDIEASPDAIAFDGLEFLRKHRPSPAEALSAID
jgi:D-psicose/D-tagatose/L-ribulose 3-epimerase